MTSTQSTYRIKGTNSDETTCACCGRDDLTKVIWLAELDADGAESQAEPYGTTCAARLLAPKDARSTSRQLLNISKAITFITKWIDSDCKLDDIRNTVGVKFNVWATCEQNTISINTPTGWVAVASR
jgi:hypothetical protein